jgi:hypothetical protein
MQDLQTGEDIGLPKYTSWAPAFSIITFTLFERPVLHLITIQAGFCATKYAKATSTLKSTSSKDNGGAGKTRELNCAYRDKQRDSGFGCGVDAPDGTFGNSFNQHKGGIWAVQVEAEGIKAWFFPYDGNVPSDALTANPDPSTWGKPVMNFAPDHCNIKTAFQRMKIVSARW